MLDFKKLGENLLEDNHQALNQQLPVFFLQLEGRLCKHLQCSMQYARELLHEVFARSFPKLLRGNIDPTAYHQYLFKAALHTEFKRPEPNEVPLTHACYLIPDPDLLEDDVETKHPYQPYLEEAIENLDEKSREIVEFLLEYPHLGNEDIAAALDLSYSNARVRKYRAFNKLRDEILNLSQ